MFFFSLYISCYINNDISKKHSQDINTCKRSYKNSLMIFKILKDRILQVRPCAQPVL